MFDNDPARRVNGRLSENNHSGQQLAERRQKEGTAVRSCVAEQSYGIMFDCAEGTQRQLLFAGYKMSRIKAMF
jgi:ribonuclease BN (tRNA processing enzyme)